MQDAIINETRICCPKDRLITVYMYISGAARAVVRTSLARALALTDNLVQMPLGSGAHDKQCSSRSHGQKDISPRLNAPH